LVDIAIASYWNVMQKKAQKKLTYKNLSIGSQRMWNMKCFAVPVITGATGILTKELRQTGNNTRKAFSIFCGKHSYKKVLQSVT
jgi:hypothetical protein